MHVKEVGTETAAGVETTAETVTIQEAAPIQAQITEPAATTPAVTGETGSPAESLPAESV